MTSELKTCEDCRGTGMEDYLAEGLITCVVCKGLGKNRAAPDVPELVRYRMEETGLFDTPLYAAPVASGADLRAAPLDPTDAMIEAALKVDFDNEDEQATIINIWHVMIAALNPSEQQT